MSSDFRYGLGVSLGIAVPFHLKCFSISVSLSGQILIELHSIKSRYICFKKPLINTPDSQNGVKTLWFLLMEMIF
jgi:hypothetical protein